MEEGRARLAQSFPGLSPFFWFIDAIWASVRDVSRSTPILVPSVMVVASCSSISNVSIRTMLASSLWGEGVVRVVVECARYFADESFSFCLCVSEGTVLVNSKKPMVIELLSEISPSGA